VRDVTLANVLVADDGTAKLADLGVAIWAEVTLTGTAQHAGTPGYVAPEVLRGQPATSASDMFSLGMTLSVAAKGETYGPLRTVLSALVDPSPARRPSAQLLSTVAAGEHSRPGSDLTPADREAALRRLTAFLLHTAYAGNQLPPPPRAPVDVGLPAPEKPHPLADEEAVVAWFAAAH
jgi:serine/threonine protein kinase